MKRLNLIYLLVLIPFSLPFLTGQSFGKNKVQYHDFNWSFIQSPHFDIYYYGDGLALAEFTSENSEIAYNQISQILNWELRKRVSIIVYNSHKDFQQTNVTYEYMPEGVGGVTELFKNRVVLPFEGSYEQLRHVIHHELVHAMINDMIYGGSVQSLISNRIKVRIPLWMNEGLAEYLSMEWDTQADMIMRDISVHDHIPQIRNLDYYLAYKGGQSVWRFIAEKYGKEKIGEIFWQVKRKQDLERGLKSALGMDFEDLSKQWEKYLKKEYWPDVAGREELEDIAHRITDHDELNNYFNIAPSISPDGSKLAILTDRNGYADIFLISSVDGKEIKKLVKGNRTPDLEELKWLQPGITWSPSGKRIAFAAKAGDLDALFILNVKTKRRIKIPFDLDGIFTAAWSPKGNEILFVGNKNGSSDIYLYNIKNKKLINLTNDVFSDSEPSWSSDGRKIVFVSDRGNQLEAPTGFKMHKHDFRQNDVYIYDLDKKVISRVTNTPYNENYPVWSKSENLLAYTSDRNGVWNIYIHDFDQKEVKSITNVLTGAFQLSWTQDNQKLYFAGYSDVGWDVYSITFPMDLVEKEVEKTNYVQHTEERGEYDHFGVKEIHYSREKIEYSSSHYTRYIFAPGYEYYNDQLVDSTYNLPAEPLAIDDYKNEDGSYRTYPYRTRFTLDYVNGQASFSNMFGYNGSALFLFSDIMGDHRIFLGTELVITLKDSDYFLRYDYLKRRNDFSLLLYHTANHIGNINVIDRIRHLAINGTVSHPLSRFQRIDFGLSSHIVNYERFERDPQNQYETTEDESLQLPSLQFNWVIDNSTWGFTAPADGWRSNVQYYQSLGFYGDKLDFKTITIDTRKYFRISDFYSLTFRLFGGHSFGKDPQKFFLGGTDNWLFGSGYTNGVRDNTRFNNDEYEDIFGNDTSDVDLKNLYFSIFTMPVRGTRYMERSGTNVALANVEFHFPFVNYLSLGFPLKMIFANIRGVAFFDVGAAWDEKLQVYTEDGPKQYKDLIGGFGLGMRINFGYFILKIDTAWDYMVGRSSKPQYYFSMGLDL
tara:strand:+ start:10239 stop:13376 length:3138 start_codon:yes stop_codon:yes gene_type:complete